MSEVFLKYCGQLIRKWWFAVLGLGAAILLILSFLKPYLPSPLSGLSDVPPWLPIGVGCVACFWAAYQIYRDQVSRTNGPKPILPNGFVLFINGGSGVGKTTIASRLARELNVYSIAGSDLVREAFRHEIERSPIDGNRILNVSSFLAYKEIRPPRAGSIRDRAVNGFRKQSSLLAGPIVMVANRIRFKKAPAILEGINIVASQILGPGLLPNDSHSSVILINLYISSEDVHRRRLWQRGADASGAQNRIEEYINHIEEIRAIDGFLNEDAKKVAAQTIGNMINVITIENSGTIDQATAAIKSKIMEKVESLRKYGLLEAR
jgi:2-phosphoglycerate kinase